MFGFLKKKIKGALEKFTKKVEEEAPEEEVEVKKEVEVKPEEATVKEEIKVEEKIKEPEEKAEEEATKEEPEEKVEEVKEAEEEALEIIEEKPAEAVEEPKAEPPKEDVKEEVEEELPEIIEEPEPESPKEEPKPKPEVKVEKPKPVEIPEPKAEKKPGPKFEKPKSAEKPTEAPKEEETPKKKGFFRFITEKITTKKISEKQFDDLFWDLELAMLENNVAVEVIEKIKSDLKKELTENPVPRGKVEDTVINSLKKSVSELFDVEQIDLLKKAKEKKPLVICFVGINGSGKTTSIAKVAHMLLQNKLSVVMAAADTFRAAAIDQLQLHADNLGVKLIKHDYGSDAAAVAFDAVKHAEAKDKDVVLIDTAGRLHSDHNLVEEMKKIVRVSKPDLIIFVGESITGNDCTEQAQKFNEAVGIDGIILSKADVDEKGGAAISVSYVTKKPIIYMGTGQEYPDLEPFSKDKIIASMGL